MKLGLLLVISFFFGSLQAKADCTLALTVQGPISASTSDYLERAEKRAKEKNCSSIFMRLNTPGGHLQTTRLIVERMLASPIPHLCLISPSGGHAGSAGAILLQACHVSGGLRATNLGAATPISGSGELPEDLRKKLINDTVSWLEGVTTLRGRNLDFSKEIVTEAKSLSVEAAVKARALDLFAESETEFLQNAQGREVMMPGQQKLAVNVGDLTEFSPDMRFRFLHFFADPEFAYLLFMGSLALLYVELTHPGLIAPGVLGGMGLIISLITFHKLDVAWGGLGLIMLGIAFLILEVFVTSFGILAIGGLISVFVGSMLLFDSDSGYTLSMGLISSVVGVLALFVLGIGYIALKTVRYKSRDTDTDLRAATGIVVSFEAGEGHQTGQGQIQITGEIWNYTTTDQLKAGDRVRVIARDGLTLRVQKKET